jgi:hypothetical protein
MRVTAGIFLASISVDKISMSETDDSRFNLCEKHMLTDSVQPYNKPIIDLACSVCTVKYQTSVFLAWTSLLCRSIHTKKPRSDISQYRPHARSISRYLPFLKRDHSAYSGVVWRDKIYGDRHQICERVEVSTIKYQLFAQPKMKYLLFTLNFNLNACCHISCPSNKGFVRLEPGLWEIAN